MKTTDKIYIAGHNGMVGSSVVRLLKAKGFDNIILADQDKLDLRDSHVVESFFIKNKPDYVILAAARVGGIKANVTYPVEFLYDNLMIQNNVIKSSHENNVKKFCFLGSSCIYPKECPQPMKEEYILTGPLEPTNEGYALAKLAGLRLTQYYNKQYGFNTINPMPCNLYGTNDSFDLEHSHVLSALVRRFTDAVDDGIKEITIWGSGIARREFMHVDDIANAIYFLMENYNSPDLINVGWGEDISIKELAMLIADKLLFSGDIIWDKTKPDGMLKKCMDVSKMKTLGFCPKISLSTGIDMVIKEYKERKAEGEIK